MNSHFLMRSIISSTFKNLRKNIHTSSTYRAPEVWQPQKKGGYGYKDKENQSAEEELWEQQSFKEKIKEEWKLLKKEFKLLKKEIKESTEGPTLIYRRGEVDVIWRFNENPECLEQWIVSSDRDYGDGYSVANLKLSSNGQGIFSGTLDVRVPKDGEITDAGFCNIRTQKYMKSFAREAAMDWSCYTHLRMRVRGDGRFYMINIGTKQTFDVNWYEMYSYPLMTRGGPYWQDIKIPFSKFMLSHKGRLQDSQRPLEQHKVASVGITCADKISGNFKLEVDYIGVEHDPFSPEEFAYESYRVTTMKM